jgi:adenosylhomocysteine nucleosidase
MILFVVAMYEEGNDILQDSIYKNDLIITGIGKTNAAMKLTEFLSNHNVDYIVNIGFAGGNIAYEVNDIVIVEKATYHDFDLSLFGYKKGQVPGYPETFLSSTYLLDKVKSALPEAKTGHLFTGDYFMTDKVDEPSVFDMEGTSLYQVAWHFKVPMISVKLISDVLGMDDHYNSYKTFEQTKGAKMLHYIYKKIKEAF